MSAPKDIVVLKSTSGLLMTKQIRRDAKSGKIVKSPYGNERHFKVYNLPLAGFSSLADALGKLTAAPHVFVVRGEPLPGINREKTRRLLYADAETGDAATFAEALRHCFAVDLDKVPAPPLTDVANDPDAAIEYLIGLLPPELRDASCWWQFTSSQSLPGAEGLLSARLWYWSRTPVDDAGLTRWALAANKAAGQKLIDPTLYRAVQPHYTASPIFDGMPDPVPQRHGIRRGLEDEVDLVIPEPDVADPYDHSGGGFVGVGVDAFLAEIGGERGFRAPMVAAVASYFATNGADADPEPIKARLREAIRAAPAGGRSEQDIERYCSERHLNDIVGWVRAREKTNPRPTVSPQAAAEFLESLGNSVPVNGERAPAIRAITEHLLRQRFLNAPLARSLVFSWNETHCTPPLPPDQVEAIVGAVAARRNVVEGAAYAG